MKATLTLKQNLPFSPAPRIVELEDDRIALNDIHLPSDRPYLPSYDSSTPRLWVIGNEYGALGAVWASNEQDALDELVDQNLAAGLAIDEKDADEETARLGNAGEPHDLTHAWLSPVEFDKVRDFNLLMKLAEARGAGLDFLSKI